MRVALACLVLIVIAACSDTHVLAAHYKFADAACTPHGGLVSVSSNAWDRTTWKITAYCHSGLKMEHWTK